MFVIMALCVYVEEPFQLLSAEKELDIGTSQLKVTTTAVMTTTSTFSTNKDQRHSLAIGDTFMII